MNLHIKYSKICHLREHIPHQSHAYYLIKSNYYVSCPYNCETRDITFPMLENERGMRQSGVHIPRYLAYRFRRASVAPLASRSTKSHEEARNPEVSLVLFRSQTEKECRDDPAEEPAPLPFAYLSPRSPLVRTRWPNRPVPFKCERKQP